MTRKNFASKSDFQDMKRTRTDRPLRLRELGELAYNASFDEFVLNRNGNGSVLRDLEPVLHKYQKHEQPGSCQQVHCLQPAPNSFEARLER